MIKLVSHTCGTVGKQSSATNCNVEKNSDENKKKVLESQWFMREQRRISNTSDSINEFYFEFFFSNK